MNNDYLNSNLSAIDNVLNEVGNASTTICGTYDYDPKSIISTSGYISSNVIDTSDAYVRISDGYVKKEILEKKIEEILDSIQDYCNNFCFQGCEGICDGETKSQCPMWNRLKCEKRV